MRMSDRRAYNSTLKPGRGLTRRTPLARGTTPLKRTPLRRSKGLEPGTPSLKKTRLRQVNPERLRALRDAQFGPQAELCRRTACGACNRLGCDPHHEPPCSCGGLDADTAPLCSGPQGCHRLRHQLGRREFERRTGVNLHDLVLEMRRVVGAEATYS